MNFLSSIIDNTDIATRLNLDSLSEALTVQIQRHLIKTNKCIIQRRWRNQVNHDWESWFEERPQWSLLQSSKHGIIACNDTDQILLDISISNSSKAAHRTINDVVTTHTGTSINLFDKIIINVNAWGVPSKLQQFIEEWNHHFDEDLVTIEWFFDARQSPISVPLPKTKMPGKELYPFLNMEPTQFFVDFINSNSNILLLMGPPGTGKTSFIRALLNYTKISAMLSFDEKILNDDTLFVSFLQDEKADILVLEDADHLLGARSDGNKAMHRFLSLGDGLVTLPNKKLIFSTNLTNIKNIDSALTRPGRCFGTLHFRKLQYEEAILAAPILGVDIPTEYKEYTLAELKGDQMSSTVHKHHIAQFGF